MQAQLLEDTDRTRKVKNNYILLNGKIMSLRSLQWWQNRKGNDKPESKTPIREQSS